MTGRGRGMALTKPSWMTNGAGIDPQAHVVQRAPQAIPVSTQEPSSSTSDWKQYSTPEGKIYYYNTKTGLSSWEKPAGFTATCPWQKYETAEGNTYYYNETSKESKWEMPQEYKTFIEAQQNTTTKYPELKNRENMTTTTSTPTSHTITKPAVATAEESKENEQARNIFIQLMRDRGVQAHFTWETTMSKIMNDPRYEVLGLLADRKAAFYQLVELLKIEEKEKINEDQDKAREDFKKLLKSHRDLNWNSSFRKFSQTIDNDPSWYGVSSDVEREFLFEEHLLVLKNKAIEREREEIIQWKKDLRSFFENAEWLNLHSQWRTVKERLVDHPSYQKLDKLECLHIFEDYIRELESRDIEKDNMSMERARRESRKAREGFRSLLDSLYSDGKFRCKNSWTEVLELVKEESRYKTLVEAQGYVSSSRRSTPGELYGDFIEVLKEEYYPQRDEMKSFLKDSSFSATGNTTQEDFLQVLNAEEKFKKCRDEFKELFYEEIMERVRKQERIAAKKKKLVILDYKDYLDYKFYKKIDKTTWDDAKAILSSHSIYKDLDDPPLAEALFKEYKKSAEEKAIVSDSPERHRSSSKKRPYEEGDDERKRYSKKAKISQ